MRGAFLLVPAFIAASSALAQGTREPPADAAPLVTLKPPDEMRADRIDSLFAKLRTAPGEDAAGVAEQAIWKLWMSSDSPTAEVLLGQAAKAMNDGAHKASLAILDTLVETYPDFAEAWNKRATLYYLMGRFKDSLADIDKVLDLEPRHFGALSGRGMIYREQKNYAAALAAFREALAVNPTMEGIKEAVKELGRLEQGI